jgi:hypothetical protein
LQAGEQAPRCIHDRRCTKPHRSPPDSGRGQSVKWKEFRAGEYRGTRLVSCHMSICRSQTNPTVYRVVLVLLLDGHSSCSLSTGNLRQQRPTASRRRSFSGLIRRQTLTSGASSSTFLARSSTISTRFEMRSSRRQKLRRVVMPESHLHRSTCAYTRPMFLHSH